MKVAFIHYHLKTGGVTTVLRQQVEAIRDDVETLVISGSAPEADLPADTVLLPELGYTHQSQKPFDPQTVAERITEIIHLKFGGECDVLHVHNPTLAKNKYFLKILNALQKKKIKLFLQIHDFAEDGRPLSYFDEAYISDCHYGVINSRDYAILIKSGLSSEGLHTIPNMVSPVTTKDLIPDSDDVVLYPIRAIRRKNIGEAILLSLFFEQGEKLAVTLPPNSPVDIKSYQDWKTFVDDQQLNVAFDAGLKDDFKELVHSSKFLITTSITEGFGFSFLEPWLYDKLIWGRKLEKITRDFEQHGIDLDHLYTRLWVPIDWVDCKDLYDRWSACVEDVCRLFKFSIPIDRIRKSFEIIVRPGKIDFGLLDEGFQKQMIRLSLSDPKYAAILKQMNPFLVHPAKVPHMDELIETNKQAVLKNYDKSSYRRKLLAIYKSVSQKPVHHRINKTIVLSEFLNLEQFSLLKWCDYLGS